MMKPQTEVRDDAVTMKTLTQILIELQDAAAERGEVLACWEDVDSMTKCISPIILTVTRYSQLEPMKTEKVSYRYFRIEQLGESK